jgi:anthranilate synthase component 1
MQRESLLRSILGEDINPLITVVEEMPADLETPVSAFLKLKDFGARFLLESVESGTVLGRYSFIGISPEIRIATGKEAMVLSDSTESISLPYRDGESPLAPLKRILSRFTIEKPASHPRLLGGAVGFISYDFVRFFEKIPDVSSNSLDFPLALFYLTDTLLVFDHLKRKLQIMCLASDSSEKTARERLRGLIDLLNAPLQVPPGSGGPRPEKELGSNFTRERFCETVLKVKQHIEAGDIYQLVLSQRLEGQTEVHPFMIYRALRMLNPSPYMFYLDFDDVKLIGSSPEALVRLDGSLATVRPIAGTRPRGKNEEESDAFARELLADEKERAEHVMLVDLGRNDLGRCCEFGSVRVTDFMKVERYSHVMHLTSNVVGELRSDLDQFDLFRAAFPAGTVTGAPKIRAMQLIEGFESLKRGPYAGAAGYFSLSGDMDWCITIRTIVMKGKRYFLQAGAGIVADSIPEREFEETMSKAAALKKAVEIAEGGLR